MKSSPSNADRVGRDDQIASVLNLRLEDGISRGVRAALLRNGGGIEALVVTDRALDIAQLSFRGESLVWHGPGGIAPAHPGTQNDDEFARSFFGGLVTTCGLDAFGPSGSDAFGSWGTHGHINHCAAQDLKVRCEIDAADGCVELRGTVVQARMMGESLRLERTWRSRIGSTQLHLHDRVTNLGGERYPHMLLYHCNAGYPLLDEHTEVLVSHAAIAPRDDQAAMGLQLWNRGDAPTPGFREQVFIHEPTCDGGGWAVAAVVNRRLRDGMGFAVYYKPAQLPALFSWRMLGVKTYVMAVEPANCPTIEGRIAAHERGTLPFLEPGEMREYELGFEMLEGRAAIDRVAALCAPLPAA